MADDLAAAVEAVLHEERVVFCGDGVHGNRRRDAVLFQRVQQTKDSNAMAVFPVGDASVVGKRPGSRAAGQPGHLEAALRRLPLHVLQHQDDAEGDPGVVGPAQGRPANDGRPLVVRVVHAEGALGRHVGRAPSDTAMA